MGLEELAVILMTNLLECYIWNLFMRNFFDYRSMPILTRNMARFGIVAVMSLINLVGSPPLNLAGILTVYTAAAYILFEGNRGRLFYFNILETLLLLFCEDVVVSLGGNSEGAFLIWISLRENSDAYGGQAFFPAACLPCNPSDAGKAEK